MLASGQQLLGLEGEPGIVAQVERELVELPPHAAELCMRIRGSVSAP